MPSDQTDVDMGYRLLFALMFVVMAPIGYWGLFHPADILEAVPFKMPPLHARFVGGIYASGCVGLLLSFFASRWIEVRTANDIALVWTGWLLLVSLLHPSEFDPANRATWIWFFGYIVFPVLAGWLYWRDRSKRGAIPATIKESWIGTYLFGQGVALCALAAILFLFASSAEQWWPWKISTFLAQLYSGPLLAYGLASLSISRARNWQDARLALAAMAAFCVLTLLASLQHTPLFVFWAPSTVLWFGAFTAAAAILSYLTVRAYTVPLPEGIPASG